MNRLLYATACLVALAGCSTLSMQSLFPERYSIGEPVAASFDDNQVSVEMYVGMLSDESEAFAIAPQAHPLFAGVEHEAQRVCGLFDRNAIGISQTASTSYRPSAMGGDPYVAGHKYEFLFACVERQEEQE